jgi:hypothetical protein
MPNVIHRITPHLALVCAMSAVLLAHERGLDGRQPISEPSSAGERILVLEVTNRSRVTAAVMAAAVAQARALFEHVGVAVERLDPASSTAAGASRLVHAPRAPAVVPVSAVDERNTAFRTLPPHILGAVVRPDAGLPDAVVLAPRVERLAARHDVDFGRLLGHVIAHEVAHLFLPRGHAAKGLMQANWRAADVRGAVRGQLRFTRAEGEQLRAALTIETHPRAAHR